MREIDALNNQILNFRRKFYNYRIMLTKTPYFDEKMFIISKIEQEIILLEYFLTKYKSDLRVRPNQQELQKITREELRQYNGENGKPAYVAVNGLIYDVTYNSKWGGGTHFGIEAGKVVTGLYNKCHGGEAILKKLKVVGTLED